MYSYSSKLWYMSTFSQRIRCVT